MIISSSPAVENPGTVLHTATMRLLHYVSIVFSLGSNNTIIGVGVGVGVIILLVLIIVVIVIIIGVRFYPCRKRDNSIMSKDK